MHWILSLQLLFGIMIARRTLARVSRKHLIDPQKLPLVAMIIFIFLFVVTFCAKSAPLFQTCAFGALMFSLFQCDSFFQWRLQRRISIEFPEFLNSVILAMKCGLSFRAAVEKRLSHPDLIWEKWLRALFDARVFLRLSAPSWAENDSDFWREESEELRQVHENPHHALARLENLRRRLQVSSEFRRKSGQALLQARIQIVVMTVLYIALLALTMRQYQIAAHERLIVLSLTLFCAGQIVFWWIARKRRWKV